MSGLDLKRGGLVIGVVHLDQLLGQPGYPGHAALRRSTLADVEALASGGVDALLLENWKDESPGPFVSPEAAICLASVAEAARAATRLPLGVNVLPNDYRTAFAIARACQLDFVQLDVLVDRVRTDYSYSQAPPFQVEVDLEDLARTRRALGVEEVPLLATIQPKHYAMLEERPLEDSARAALAAGAQAVVVTGTATGSAPASERVARVRAALPQAAILVGSGLTTQNAAELLAWADGAIVGTSLRAPGLGPVVEAQVRAVVQAARAARRGG